MRTFASNARSDNHPGDTSLARPFFGMHQQHSSNARAAAIARNHEPADLAARIGLKMMDHRHIDPPHHGTFEATDKHNVVRERNDTSNPFLHSVRGNRISKLAAQFGSGLSVREIDFADGKRVQDIAFT